jgi:hypothetical protein
VDIVENVDNLSTIFVDNSGHFLMKKWVVEIVDKLSTIFVDK